MNTQLSSGAETRGGGPEVTSAPLVALGVPEMVSTGSRRVESASRGWPGHVKQGCEYTAKTIRNVSFGRRAALPVAA